MKPFVFQGPCPRCGKVVKFIELKAEPCSPHSLSQRRYAFRCLECHALFESVTDCEGRTHRWVEGTHVVS